MRSHQFPLFVAAVFAFLLLQAAGAAELLPFPGQKAGVPYPTREWPELDASDAQRQAIEAEIAVAFEGARPVALAKTKAVLVIAGGRVAGERYAAGISRETRLQSWSMSKSFLHAALGIAIAEGKLDAARPAAVDEWAAPGDTRQAITPRQLAQMTDGLAFREDYGDATSSAMQMLFGAGRGDVGRSAAMSRAQHQPGTKWSYSSGSANILSRILRQSLGGRDASYEHLQRKLFQPLGITSAVAEFDASGTWIASSYIHATARDYARFGLLYLRGGVWEGKQIVPRDWIDVGRTPTLSSKGQYGALFWLNAADPDSGALAISQDVPEDTFLARGFGGQLIAIVPSRDAVIVMLNAAYSDDATPIVTLVGKVLQKLKVTGRR